MTNTAGAITAMKRTNSRLTSLMPRLTLVRVRVVVSVRARDQRQVQRIIQCGLGSLQVAVLPTGSDSPVRATSGFRNVRSSCPSPEMGPPWETQCRF